MNSTKKNMLSTTMIGGLLAISFGVTAVPAIAQEQAAAAADEGSNQVIVVTARKREENILKTPVSVSALSSQALQVRGIVSVNDVANNTPGINISNISSGRNDRSFQQIALRGFAPTTAQSTLTATFIDGVPVASATALNTITDPERIEILKGPQSAYFGRNTFAGAVNVVNKMPGKELGGAFTLQGGTRNNIDASAALEGPLVSDLLGFRITGRYFKKDGSYKNQADTSERLGDQKTRSATLLLVATPSDKLTIKAFGLLSQNDDGPSAQGMLSAYEVRANNGTTNIPGAGGTPGLGTLLIPSLSNCTLNGLSVGRSASEAHVSRPYICGAAPGLPKGFSPAQNTLEDSLLQGFLSNGAYRVVSPKDGVQGYGLKSQYYHLHLNIDYELGPVTLSSLTGYNNEYYSELADLDNYDTRLLTNPANPTGANPNLRNFWDFPFMVERKTRDFSQEVRASFDDKGPLRAIIGASYLKTKADSDLVSGNGAIVGGIARPGSTRQPPQKAVTKGVFFGVTYDISEQFTVSAEGRYQSDKIFAFTGGNPAGLTINPNNAFGLPAGTYGPLTSFYSKTFKKFLPRVIGQFNASPDTMFYASWSKGVNISLSSFNTSFLNGSPTVQAGAAAIDLGVIVQPETLSNFEVGVKGKFFDGKVRASLAGYYATWKNQHNQRSILVNDSPPPTGTGVIQIVSGVANSGKAIVKGIEFDMTAYPIEGLQIDYSAALNDSRIRSFADPSISKLSGVIDDGFKGNQLHGTSKYSANLGLQYGTPIAGWDKGAWFVRSDISYKSKIYADEANLTWIKSRTLVNFRAGISRGGFGLEGFVMNAFNNKRYTSISNNAVLTPNFAISATNSYLNVGLPELRTFGVKASYKF